MRWDDHPAHKPKPINTSFPLLFISNTYDPVTPLPAGLKMARQFTNAGFFEVLTEGHCSLAAPSLCSFQKISSYLRVGIVPKPPGAFKKGEGEIEQEKRDWETCRADGWPWKSPVEAESQDLEGQRLLKLQEAWERVEGASRIAGNWLGRGLDLGVMEGKRMSDRTKEWMAMYVDGVENHECDGEFSDCL